MPASLACATKKSFIVGTRVVSRNGTFYLFGRTDNGTAVGGCAQGTIAVNVRASTDAGASWSAPSPLATPDLASVCQYADGGAFFDETAQRWHYIVQSLAPAGAGGWTLSHFSSATADPLGPWIANARNPVVRGGATTSYRYSLATHTGSNVEMT